MRTFITVLKNNYLRLMPRMISVSVFALFTLGSVFLAIYITHSQQVKAHVVFILQSSSSYEAPKSSKSLNVTVADKKPPLSALMEQKYDAYVTTDKDGNYSIDTLRNNDFRNMLFMLLKNPESDISGGRIERGVGVNIIGFLMMFLLMIAFYNLFCFADDKEQGQLVRIASTPDSFGWYLASHCVYCLSMLLPEYLLLIILKLCGWDIGFTLIQYAYLLCLVAFFGISFALLLNTLIKKPDNASMLGNSVMILTSILAGCFYSFSKDSPVLDGIIKILPQKELLTFAQSIQTGDTAGHIGSLIYTIAFPLTLFVFSCVILKRKYVKKV